MVRSGRGIRFLTVSGHRMPSSKGLTYHVFPSMVVATRLRESPSDGSPGMVQELADTETMAMASKTHLKGMVSLPVDVLGSAGVRVAGPDREALRRRQIQTPGERLASLSARLMDESIPARIRHRVALQIAAWEAELAAALNPPEPVPRPPRQPRQQHRLANRKIETLTVRGLPMAATSISTTRTRPQKTGCFATSATVAPVISASARFR